MARYIASAGVGAVIGYCMPKISTFTPAAKPVEDALGSLPFPKPSLSLMYFDLTGRAEAIRQAFVLGGIPFEDKRVAFSDWAKVKPTTRSGQMPEIKIDGRVYSQSMAILRYAGKLARLYPTDPVDALAVDEAIAIANEMESAVSILFSMDLICKGMSDKDKAKRKVVVGEALAEDKLPPIFARLEQLVRESPSGWIAGTSGPTVADLVVAGTVEFFSGPAVRYGLKEGLVTKATYPGLLALVDQVHALPAVAKWDADHPSK